MLAALAYTTSILPYTLRVVGGGPGDYIEVGTLKIKAREQKTIDEEFHGTLSFEVFSKFASSSGLESFYVGFHISEDFDEDKGMLLYDLDKNKLYMIKDGEEIEQE